MAKKLVINADDYGLSEEINSRIINCYTQGAVTDISILAVGDSFEHAAWLAREKGIKRIGVHLALTGRFKAASPREKIPTLVDKDAKFSESYRSFLARYFTGRVKYDDIYTELKNQLSKVKNAHFKITHADSHQHIHVIPGILKIALELMKKEGIEYIRFPLEKINFSAKIRNPRGFFRNILLSSMCGVSGRILEASGLKYADGFIGHAYALRLRRKGFITAISNLKEGLTELGCHPGNREEEARALCDAGFTDELKARSVELVSY